MGSSNGYLAAALEPPLPKLGLELLDHTSADVALCAKIAGFSLHAARVVPAHDREGLFVHFEMVPDRLPEPLREVI